MEIEHRKKKKHIVLLRTWRASSFSVKNAKKEPGSIASSSSITRGIFLTRFTESLFHEILVAYTSTPTSRSRKSASNIMFTPRRSSTKQKYQLSSLANHSISFHKLDKSLYLSLNVTVPVKFKHRLRNPVFIRLLILGRGGSNILVHLLQHLVTKVWVLFEVL